MHHPSTFIYRASMISNYISTAVRHFFQGCGLSCFSLLKNTDEPQTGHRTIVQWILGHQCGYLLVGLPLSLWHLDIPRPARVRPREPQQRDMTLCMLLCRPK